MLYLFLLKFCPWLEDIYMYIHLDKKNRISSIKAKTNIRAWLPPVAEQQSTADQA
jgi:hypothetical protein